MGSKNILTIIFILAALILLTRTILLVWDTYLADFSIFYQAVFVGFSKENPYLYTDFFAPYVYPPIFLVLMYPLSFFSFQTAANTWILLSVLFYLLSIFLLRSLLKTSFFLVSIVFLLSVLSFPFKFTLGMGQVNFFLLFSICTFVYFFKKNILVSSIFFWVATIIKIFPVVFFYPLILKKEYLSLVVIFMVFLCALLISMVLFPDEHTSYYLFHVFPSVISGGIKQSYYNQSLLGTLARFGIENTASIFQISIGVLTITLLGLKKPVLISSVSLLITAILLLSSFAWQHHLLLLMIPFFYLLSVSKKKHEFILLLLSYILIAVNIKSPAVFQQSLYGLFILSHATWGMILLYVLLIFSILKVNTNEK